MNPVDTSFMEQAECRGMPAELFHPERHDYALIKAAKAVCSVCPVVEQCLDYALRLADRDAQGVLGNTTAIERRRIRRQRRSEGTLAPSRTHATKRFVSWDMPDEPPDGVPRSEAVAITEACDRALDEGWDTGQ